MALRPADESNDFCAQDNPSHTAMTTSPANASAIKYAVMSFSRSESKLRHDRLRDHFRREPYLHQMETACGRGLGPRRVPANEGESCFL
jgi:hypothetical protein